MKKNKKLGKQCTLGGIVTVVALGSILLGAGEEKNFHRIAENVDEYRLSLYYAPYYPEESFEEMYEENPPVSYFVNLSKEDEKFHDLMEIMADYSYERPKNSVKTEGHQVYANGMDFEYALHFDSVAWEMGIPVEQDVIVITDQGDMNVNKRTYHIGESGAELIEKVLAYMEENPDIVRVMESSLEDVTFS